ncbi:hypothetical protein EC844_11713 [Acinetobacter calcoaceticus]|uniref:Uncharacterized protein n=1 Tax=Acinetobacter calcoaceticus TaxID=471 RepID=A0A4R1XKE4_ACICA|nr:hypothetical protein EC844_11713 [Acinetobacter calcoaceticus]
MINNSCSTLKQIYAFVEERPGLGNKTQKNMIIEFLATLHYGDPSEFQLEQPYKVKGRFGACRLIDIQSAPKFTDKDIFITWVEQKINNQT